MPLADWSDSTGEKAATIKDLEVVFEKVVGVVLGFVGIALFVLLVIGGIKYITSAGDPKAIEGAKKTITSAIAGLLLIILSVIILQFIQKFTEVEITIFKIFY